MEPVRQTFLLDHSQDTVKVEFTLYHINDFIRGRIVADGDPMVANRRIVAYNDTTGSSEIFSNHDGSFSIPVSDKANNYFVRMEWDDFDQFMNAGFQYWPAINSVFSQLSLTKACLSLSPFRSEL